MNDDQNILDDVFLKQDETSEDLKKKKAELKLMQRKINRAGNFLFAIGIVTIFSKIFYSSTTPELNDILLYIATGGFYIGMGVLAIYKPIVGLGLSLVVYLGLYLIAINFNPQYFGSGIIIRLFVSLILVTGISNAIQANQFKKEHNL